MNKILLFLIFSLFHSIVFSNSFSPGYVITQDNSDITVNLREEESLHAKVLAKIPTDTVLHHNE